MWIVEYRAMTPEERDELEELLETGRDVSRLALGALLGAAVGLAVAPAAPVGHLLRSAAVLSGSILGLLGAGVLGRRRRRAFARAIREDLKDGKVQVLHVAPDDIIRLRSPGGSIAGYIASIGDGQLLFMEPRDWNDVWTSTTPEPEHLFPSSRFSLIRAPQSQVDLGLIPEGERFPPTREIEVERSDLLEDGDILQADLESLGRRIHPLPGGPRRCGASVAGPAPRFRRD